MVLVAGVGIGVMVLGIVWGLALLLCLSMSRAQGAASNLGIVTVLLALLLTVILVVLPREPLTASAEESVVVYDYSIIYRSLLIAGCGLFLLIGLVAYLTTHVMEPHYAKPLRRLRT
ncbi:transmembrane protein 218-like [Mizuhopecten yessoensis]|uniref:transmembrane protein 218-like n=1 Tax=Mizuhopecten yessoensis TaxID=6573 RepID=UPI000B458D51|nr:transmembrane protein 218-like [Mizuhopecten yessoensis]